MERNRLLGISVVTIAIVSVAVIVIVALGDKTTALDPTTPEGVVQQYVAAVAEQDAAAAHALFTRDLAERCSISDISQNRADDIARVSIGEVTVTGDSAVVDVIVTRSRVDDPLDTSTWDEDVTFFLVDDGGWMFDEISWPYFSCRRFNS